jgi:putative redox protein
MLEATVRHAGNLTFVGKSNSNHWTVMDGSQKIGADDGATRPKELLLLALGGCTAFDVEMILRKRRVGLRRFEVSVRAEESSEHPMVFTSAELTYYFEGDGIAVPELERAIRLSQEKYCSVSTMLRQAFPISWKAILNGDEVLSGSETA